MADEKYSLKDAMFWCTEYYGQERTMDTITLLKKHGKRFDFEFTDDNALYFCQVARGVAYLDMVGTKLSFQEGYVPQKCKFNLQSWADVQRPVSDEYNMLVAVKMYTVEGFQFATHLSDDTLNILSVMGEPISCELGRGMCSYSLTNRNDEKLFIYSMCGGDSDVHGYHVIDKDNKQRILQSEDEIIKFVEQEYGIQHLDRSDILELFKMGTLTTNYVSEDGYRDYVVLGRDGIGVEIKAEESGGYILKLVAKDGKDIFPARCSRFVECEDMQEAIEIIQRVMNKEYSEFIGENNSLELFSGIEYKVEREILDFPRLSSNTLHEIFDNVGSGKFYGRETSSGCFYEFCEVDMRNYWDYPDWLEWGSISIRTCTEVDGSNNVLFNVSLFFNIPDDEPLEMKIPNVTEEQAIKYIRVAQELGVRDIIDNPSIVDSYNIADNRRTDMSVSLDELGPRYISFGITEIPENFRSISSRSLGMKPCGGLWACEYFDKPGAHSAWEEFCRCQEYGLDKLNTGMIFSIAKDARVLIIDSKEDLDALCDTYPRKGYIGNILSMAGMAGMSPREINWEAAQKDYDVFIFTEGGRSAIDSDLFSAPLDVPSIVVANPKVIVGVEPYSASENDMGFKTDNDEVLDEDVILGIVEPEPPCVVIPMEPDDF